MDKFNVEMEIMSSDDTEVITCTRTGSLMPHTRYFIEPQFSYTVPLELFAIVIRSMLSVCYLLNDFSSWMYLKNLCSMTSPSLFLLSFVHSQQLWLTVVPLISSVLLKVGVAWRVSDA
ncbi:hypothetical protein NC653_031077 [Populus alba x Populus x berolinensis]|uniref:Uncharacterized protein n=1 Tax=Populus alba x Populus x berolinensis TaxID=444605 RepID=A0AAD6LXH6_9ROSI|nr:hypothetical protein NC653_031077 [Populus alba x Populus x berolinensis]